MNVKIIKASYEQAKDISNWQYDKPYKLYSGKGSNEEIQEILNNNYYVVVNEYNELVGFYCYGKAAQVPTGNSINAYIDSSYVDIGIGIRPDLCGRGYGYTFFTNGLKFAQEQLGITKIRLTVANFNKRAIKVYEKAGFKKVLQFNNVVKDKQVGFSVMIKNVCKC